MHRLFPLLALTACSAPSSEYLVYDYIGQGTHELAPVQLDELTDPIHMRGELGDITLGGRIAYDDDRSLIWRAGPPVSLQYVVDDGVMVPIDDQGIILLSFYHHLAVVRADLSARGWQDDMQHAFPLSAIAYAPAQITGHFLGVENAAYVSAGIHAFILFEEANNEVPLTAHAGVVRHEFGHTWFGVIAKELDQPSDDTIVVEDLRALNEGFADIVATLSLDDPLALPIAGRDPRNASDSSQYNEADPYSLGVVFSGFAWDIRLILDDAPHTLEIVVDALRQWLIAVEDERYVPISLSFSVALFDAAAAHTGEAALCPAFRARFPNVVDRCAE